VQDVLVTKPPLDLADAISAAIAQHDPLDPWLVVSNLDESYWDDVATKAAPLVAMAKSPSDIYEVLIVQMEPFIRPPEKDQYVQDRIVATAESVWQWLQQSTESNPWVNR
jgi:hypothetical protein